MNKPAPKTYRTTNWSSYNRALVNRGNILIWFDPTTQWYAQPKGEHGRNQTYSDAAIQCCLMIKSLFRLTLRMVTGFVQSLIKLCSDVLNKTFFPLNFDRLMHWHHCIFRKDYHELSCNHHGPHMSSQHYGL